VDSATIALMGAGLLSGFSKFSVGGMGMLILPILMIAYPGPEALGILVPLYLLTDLVVVALYRQQVDWRVLLRLLPLQLLGMLAGSWLLAGLATEQFSPLIGGVIIGMLLLGFYLDRHDTRFMRHPAAACSVGLVAGVFSMIASAAGPLLSLYMMEQRLSKQAYVSTRAWSFLLIDLAKIPLLWTLGFLDLETALQGLPAVPSTLLGAWLGYALLSRLALTQFKWLIRLMAALAAVKIFVMG